jgi:hypothetical protein
MFVHPLMYKSKDIYEQLLSIGNWEFVQHMLGLRLSFVCFVLLGFVKDPIAACTMYYIIVGLLEINPIRPGPFFSKPGMRYFGQFFYTEPILYI